jgi:hypothetical protein
MPATRKSSRPGDKTLSVWRKKFGGAALVGWFGGDRKKKN